MEAVKTIKNHAGHKVIKRATLCLSWIVVVLILAAAEGRAVPAMPNETFITGTFVEYGILSSRLLNMQPEQTIYKLTITVISSGEVAGMPSLLKMKEGENITVYSKEALSQDLFGNRIRMKAQLSGDERGQRLWMNSVEVIR